MATIALDTTALSEILVEEYPASMAPESLTELVTVMPSICKMTSQRDVEEFLWLNFFPPRAARRAAVRIVALSA